MVRKIGTMVLAGAMILSMSMTALAANSPSKGRGGSSAVGKSSVATVSSGAGSSTTSRAETEGAWKLEGNTWRFKKSDGSDWKGSWIVSKHQWYYLDADGGMVQGWKQINGVWYYFSASVSTNQPVGSCYLDRITPDGYRVDANGAWIK